MKDDRGLPWHENPDDFRDALAFTAAQTGFAAALIEKDYYCSLLLAQLEALFAAGLVFKGGTALSKVHAAFHRLSEDLDFVVSIAVDSSRPARRLAIEPIKRHLQDHHQEIKGADQSRHYTAIYHYESCLTNDRANIKLEFGLRELLVELPEPAVARTLLLDRSTVSARMGVIPVTVMSRRESYSEKIRAAFCRREPAIRDFYDIDHAIQAGILDPADGSLRKLVRHKLAVPGNDPPDLSDSRVDTLRRQVGTQLRPVLREDDFVRFELDRAIEFLHGLGIQLS